MGSSYLPSLGLSQSLHTFVGQVRLGRKDGCSTCFRLCDRFSGSRQASGCLWLPLLLLLLLLHLLGAEGAERVHHVVREHLRLPLRLQRADPLPVHILSLANSAGTVHVAKREAEADPYYYGGYYGRGYGLG